MGPTMMEGDPDVARLEAELNQLEPARGSTTAAVTKDHARALRETVEVVLRSAPTPSYSGAHRAVLAELVASHLVIAGDPLSARRLLGLAAEVTEDELHRAQIREGMDDVGRQLALVHGRWLVAHHRFEDAERVLAPLTGDHAERAIAEVARRALDTPRPVTETPRLASAYGCGQGLYGPRDAHPDGTYVMTLCVMFGGFPIFPVRAYRLRPEEDGWIPLAEVPLSPFARRARWFSGAAIVILLLAFVIAFLVGIQRAADGG